MRKERELFSKCVPRKVPVVWVGSASEVRLVGDFDQWTRGVDLSNPEIEGDSVLRTFEATLNLLPVSESARVHALLRHLPALHVPLHNAHV